MKKYLLLDERGYCASGVFLEGIDIIPEGAIEVTDEEERKYLERKRKNADGTWADYEMTPEEKKKIELYDAKRTFIKERDAIRWVTCADGNTYGFDCANEDIVNFMAGQKMAEIEGKVYYKVWLTATTKGLVVLTKEDFAKVFAEARQSQIVAYAKYEAIKKELSNG